MKCNLFTHLKHTNFKVDSANFNVSSASNFLITTKSTRKYLLVHVTATCASCRKNTITRILKSRTVDDISDEVVKSVLLHTDLKELEKAIEAI